MGAYYLHDGTYLRGTGSCPDGEEHLQGNGFAVALGAPPPGLKYPPAPPEDYATRRVREYPSINDQLGALWKHLDASGQTLQPEAQSIFDQISAVKAKHPKS